MDCGIILINDYKERHMPTREKLKSECYGVTDFNKLIIVAERFFKDHWWPYYIYNDFKNSLEKFKEVIYKNQSLLITCKSFEDFLEMFYKFKNGTELRDFILGATLLYDIALVFGMSIGSLPIKVYANNPGTTQATAKVILGKDYNTKKERYESHIRFNLSDFPKEMHVLEAHEVEDFLCIYYNTFQYLNELRD